MARFPLFRTALMALPLMLTLAGCKKEFDSPPERILGTGDVLTIADLRAMYTGVSISWRDSADKSVYAVVTADEQNGNLYKNIYVQDNTGAIVMRLKNSGGLYQGDSIRIYLPGTVLSSYAGMLQLDSVDVDENIVKQATNVWVEPQVVSIAQLGPELQGKLVRLNEVQFAEADTNKTYANAVTQATENRMLENCTGADVIVRNSGYANFAGLPVPNGKGSFVGVLGQFNEDMQLFIRDLDEVQLNGPRCGMAECTPAAGLSQDFSSVLNAQEVSLECWLNVFTQGSGIRKWRGQIVGSEMFANAAPSSGDTPIGCELWLVGAPLAFTPGMALSFSSALGNAWQHDGLSVWISTDINLLDGEDVAAAPWVQVTGIPLAGNGTPENTWVPTGNIVLDPYLTAGQSFVVGFKYNGVSITQATQYRIDNVVVQ
jgi:hypothetical protein